MLLRQFVLSFSPFVSTRKGLMNQHFERHFSNWGVIKKSDLEKLIEKSNSEGKRSFALVDVREPYELRQTGKIPTSINIPRTNFFF